jgi:hypothetical protein
VARHPSPPLKSRIVNWSGRTAMSDKRAAFINAVRNQVSIGLSSVRKCTGGNVVR